MFYTYSIKNLDNGKFYIGSRTAKCLLTRKPEDDLGVKYFSSSKDKELREAIKNQRVKYTILPEYDDTKVCWRAEQQLIALYWKLFGKDMSYNYSCVNCNGEVIFNRAGITSPMKGKHPSEESIKKMSEAKKGKSSNMKGKHHSKESKKKMSKAMLGRYVGKTLTDEQKHRISDALTGHICSEETKQKISKSHIGKPGYWEGKTRDDDTNIKISYKLSGSKWMNNNKEVKYITPNEIEKYLKEGWKFGRKIKHK